MTSPLDLVKNADELRSELYPVHLSTARWRQFVSPQPLLWKKMSFSAANRTQVPKARGIYAFSLELPDHNLPAHGYILYVGIAGNTGGATLQSRYSQYLGEMKRRKARPKVVYMMAKWPRDLVYNYVEIPDTKVNLRVLETSLVDAIFPYVNKRDFSAKIQKARDAFS